MASPGGEAAGQLAGQVITQLGADVNRELRVEGSCEVRPTDGDRSYENGPRDHVDPVSQGRGRVREASAWWAQPCWTS